MWSVGRSSAAIPRVLAAGERSCLAASSRQTICQTPDLVIGVVDPRDRRSGAASSIDSEAMWLRRSRYSGSAKPGWSAESGRPRPCRRSALQLGRRAGLLRTSDSFLCGASQLGWPPQQLPPKPRTGRTRRRRQSRAPARSVFSGWKVSHITASSSVQLVPIDFSARPGCGPCGRPEGCSVTSPRRSRGAIRTSRRRNRSSPPTAGSSGCRGSGSRSRPSRARVGRTSRARSSGPGRSDGPAAACARGR
jgi:hypothetical protein